MTPSTSSLLQRVLEQHPPETRDRILRLVHDLGYSENDPLFAVLLTTSSVQVLLEEAPEALRQTFDNGQQRLLERLDDYQRAAAKGVEHQIAKAVSEALKKAREAKSEITLKSMAMAAGAIATMLTLGALAGYSWAQWQVSQERLDPSGARQLTLDEAKTLDWAQSPQGQFARHLMEWNAGLLDGECQEQVKDLGITMYYGNQQAVDGFCFLWVEPPSQRTFR